MGTIKKLVPLWTRARVTVLTLGGFGSLTAAAWTVALPLGLAVAGLSCFALEYLTDNDGRNR
ncbi:hypothetical protein IPZ58_07550 [Streptomyces roseoverticillatus]|uniref:hypothetical protein n=1 Tax=Streptomyces roseoverticillatus TaxID=66429 RepID=UPI001F30B25D|nr:hypothetical protein [Streptomyces roseoverticillatus]MCF3101434.1 hypothetical protein [Streptomyces roseoverticillatus]